MKTKLLLILFFLLSFILKAQEPVSVHLTEKDGLPDKEFYNMIEDRQGFIWLCADKGLFRYDGKTFKNYTNKAKRGLSVFGSVEDHLGRIWINNISGQFFYVENDELITFIDLGKELKGELPNFKITKKHLIVFAKYKAYYINLVNKTLEKTIENDFKYGEPYKLNDSTLFATLAGLYLLNEAQQKKELIQFKLPKLAIGATKIQANQASKVFKLDTLLFVCHSYNKDNLFYKLDIDNKSYTETDAFKALKDARNTIFFEDNNKLWITSSHGVHVYASINGILTLEKHFLQDYFVTKMIKDKDDNFWFTTLNNGVFVIPNIHIESYNISEENKNISCLEKVDDNTLFFGTNTGDVGLYNTKTHTQNIIDLPFKYRVSAIKYHPQKQLFYVSKDNAGSFVIDANTKQVILVRDFHDAKSFSIVSNQDVLYVKSNIVKFIWEEGNINKEKKISVNRRGYTSLYNPHKKSTYIGYVDDLVVYDSDWNLEPIQYNKAPIYAITLTQTKNNVVWAGTFKNGIFGIKDNKVIHHITISEGLISNRIEKIKADGNMLWIATDSGIQLINVATNEIKTLTKRDGVVSYKITGIEILEDKVVFSSNEGMFTIDKNNAFKGQKLPKVYFSKIEVNEISKPITSEYEFDYDQNTIKIDFNVNGFQFNQKGKYTYRLLGLKKDWITTSSSINTVKYNSLPAGDYTFEVKAILEGYENTTIKSFQFSIEKPFWKRWWFVLSGVILVLGSIIFYYQRKIKIKEINQQGEVKKLSLDNELIALKLENLRSQMNPHFIFNALNSIQEYIVLNQKKLASTYLGKFADLIRTYLEHSTKGTITLYEEIACLKMYLELEKLRFEDKLAYQIKTPNNVFLEAIKIPTMLIQPYVENALKHGLLHRKKDRVLTVNFTANTQLKTIVCQIIDNGVGRDKAAEFKARSHKKHKSFATKATQSRLALLNYGKEKEIGVTITDLFKDKQPTGTKVEITIPYTTL